MDAREAARLAGRDAQVAIDAAEIAVRAATPKPADPRSAPFFDLLVTAERTAFARILPRRNRWPQLKAIDDRLVELDQQQAQATAELAGLRQDLQQAERDHPAELAAWISAGRTAARPEQDAARIGPRIAELEAELAAFTTLIEQTAQEKAAYVGKHRKRLVADAGTARDQARDRYLALVAGLLDAREELVATAQTVTWASLFPSDSLTGELNTRPLAAGLVKPLREAVPGLTTQLTLADVTRLLETDARVISDARTREQEAARQGIDARTQAAAGATWASTEEGRAKERAEKRQAIERYRKEWGREPE